MVGQAVVQSLGNYSDYQRKKAANAAAPPQARAVKLAPKPVPTTPETIVLRAQCAKPSRMRGGRFRLESKLNEISDALTIAEVDQDFEKMADLSGRFEHGAGAAGVGLRGMGSRQR
ncbi:MAG: hypothetical protein R2855_02395 [Thermomicrobiales bacterium]